MLRMETVESQLKLPFRMPKHTWIKDVVILQIICPRNRMWWERSISCLQNFVSNVRNRSWADFMERKRVQAVREKNENIATGSKSTDKNMFFWSKPNIKGQPAELRRKL